MASSSERQECRCPPAHPHCPDEKRETGSLGVPWRVCSESSGSWVEIMMTTSLAATAHSAVDGFLSSFPDGREARVPLLSFPLQAGSSSRKATTSICLKARREKSKLKFQQRSSMYSLIIWPLQDASHCPWGWVSKMHTIPARWSAQESKSDRCYCLVVKSCPTLCNPMDSSPPVSSAHGIS